MKDYIKQVESRYDDTKKHLQSLVYLQDVKVSRRAMHQLKCIYSDWCSLNGAILMPDGEFSLKHHIDNLTLALDDAEGFILEVAKSY